MARITPIIHEDAAWLIQKMDQALNEFCGKTLLVTGAYGFLGAYLIDMLAAWNQKQENPCHILALDNNLVGLTERLDHLKDRKDIDFIQADITRPFISPEPVHYIFHLAGIASPIFYRQHPLETIDVNVQGTRNLLELCRTQPVRAMLHLSTSEIYGDPSPDAIPTPEDYRGFVSCTGPRACYDESKRMSETLCVLYHQKYGVPVKVGRPFNVYGPGQRIDDKRIVPDLMQAVLSDRPITLFSNGKATRSFCYIRDAAWAMLLILLKGRAGEAYNLGNDREEVTMLQVAQTLHDIAKQAHPIEFQTSKDPNYLADNPQRRCPDLKKIKELGFDAQILLQKGLARTLDSYRQEA